MSEYYQVQYTCRITWGKFSYFLPPEWVFTTDPDDLDALHYSVQRRWSIIKGTEVKIEHLRVQSVRNDVKPSANQIVIGE
jgi:hypothetical protein